MCKEAKVKVGGIHRGGSPISSAGRETTNIERGDKHIERVDTSISTLIHALIPLPLTLTGIRGMCLPPPSL